MLAVDTQETFEVIVPEDARKPREQQRRIVCPYMTMRQLSAFRAKYAAALKIETDEGFMAAVSDVLLSASPRFEGPWPSVDGGSLPDMTVTTAMDLCEQLPTEQMLTERERKKSARQSQSASGNSAAAAAA